MAEKEVNKNIAEKLWTNPITATPFAGVTARSYHILYSKRYRC